MRFYEMYFVRNDEIKMLIQYDLTPEDFIFRISIEFLVTGWVQH